MTLFFRSLAIAAVAFTPALANAQTLTCPEPAEVFAVDRAEPLAASVPQLAGILSGAELRDKDLRSLAGTLGSDYPEASDPEIADLMIAAYCNYLRDEGSFHLKAEANMEQFEKQAYTAVLGTLDPAYVIERSWKMD